MAINISSRGGWPANVLSNFAATPFVLDGVPCASAEGFIQALKFPNPAMQRHICALVGMAAKSRGSKATRRIVREQSVWWLGQRYVFRSTEHYALVRRALRAKYTQCDRARRALLATYKATLTHNVGKESPHTSLPAREFIRMLNSIRAELNATTRSE